tara:strand:+ start:277 stop:495 length:219 start_codon:yes stop_codon:yes gene_type:complete
MQRLTIHLRQVAPVMEERLVTVMKNDKKTKEMKSVTVIKNTIAIEVRTQDDIDTQLKKYARNIKKSYLSYIM